MRRAGIQETCKNRRMHPSRLRRSPEQPTRDEVEQHNSHHEPYRSWCPACVAGRGRSFAHSM
eukprot:1841932-Karenia_brevis.AAC.1